MCKLVVYEQLKMVDLSYVIIEHDVLPPDAIQPVKQNPLQPGWNVESRGLGHIT